MKHEIKVKEIYYNKIKSGQKIYEVCLNDEKRQKIKTGDTLIIWKEPEMKEYLETTVADLLYFSSFEEMCKTLGSVDIGLEDKTPEEVVDVYHQFYSTENENNYGVLAIKVKI